MPAMFRTDSVIFGDIQASNMVVTGEIKVGETQQPINQYITQEVNTTVAQGNNYNTEISGLSGQISGVSGYTTGLAHTVGLATGDINSLSGVVSGILENSTSSQGVSSSAFSALSGYSTGLSGVLNEVTGVITGDINTLSAQIAETTANLYSFYKPENNTISNVSANLTALNLQPTNVPTSGTAPGTKGDITYDENFVYLCVETNTWRRLSAPHFTGAF